MSINLEISHSEIDALVEEAIDQIEGDNDSRDDLIREFESELEEVCYDLKRKALAAFEESLDERFDEDCDVCDGGGECGLCEEGNIGAEEACHYTIKVNGGFEAHPDDCTFCGGTRIIKYVCANCEGTNKCQACEGSGKRYGDRFF